MFGIGGPYSTSFGAFLGTVGTGVIYFQASSQQMAVEVGGIVSRILSIRAIEPKLLDASTLLGADEEKFVIENSGLDMQIVLRR
jgi:hypothetical protein